MSKFGKLEGLYAREIFAEAAKEAFDRCPNLNPKKDIKALFVGQMGESYEHQGHTGQPWLTGQGFHTCLPLEQRRLVRLQAWHSEQRFKLYFQAFQTS